jgi:F-type H+-transporting ATPase subunit b
MQLDWSTLILEVVNFLVLVWLLKRFLYRPILNVVTARQAAIEQAAARTAQAEERARTLETQYNARLQNWEHERASARDALREELQAERQRALVALNQSLDQAREQARVLDERRQAEMAERSERLALEQGTAFVRRLLTRLSGSEVQSRLVQLAIDELSLLAEPRKAQLREALSSVHVPGVVSSAFTLAPSQREALTRAIEGAIGDGHAWTFREDSALIAGVRVSVGPWVFHANLSEELSLFHDAAGEQR